MQYICLPNGIDFTTVQQYMFVCFSERNFAWIDLSTVQFTHWAPGEPNGDEAEEDCVEIYYRVFPGMWNDHSCNLYNNYVCKVRKSKCINEVNWKRNNSGGADGIALHP